MDRLARSHPALHGRCGAVLALGTGGDRWVVLFELTARPRLDLAEVVARIRRTFEEGEGIAVDTIVLVAPASLPRNAAGELEYAGCRAAFQASSLATIASWQAAPRVRQAPPLPPSASAVH